MQKMHSQNDLKFFEINKRDLKPLQPKVERSKPLSCKGYGSIPHLPGSKTGPAEHTINPGQARILLEKPRDLWDTIIITEKLDGANCSVTRVDGELIALTRSGLRADQSTWLNHRLFASWVYYNDHLFINIQEGERVVGEWIAQAHGTRYKLSSMHIQTPFIAFDLFDKQNQRVPFMYFHHWCNWSHITTAHCIHIGQSIPLKRIKERLSSHHGAIDTVEGAVVRVERRGKFDFIAKFIQQNAIPGRYLPEICPLQKEPIWNFEQNSHLGDLLKQIKEKEGIEP